MQSAPRRWEALQSRPERAKDLFRGVHGETHGELILLRSLLEQFLACDAYRPGQAETG